MTPSLIVIRWWPFPKSHASWLVRKETEYNQAATVLPASISAGTRPSDPISPKAAREHADQLQYAAALCDDLDVVIKDRADFQHVQVIERGDARFVIGKAGDSITIGIPDQREYRAAQWQRTGGRMAPIVAAAEREAQSSPTA